MNGEFVSLIMKQKMHTTSETNNDDTNCNL